MNSALQKYVDSIPEVGDAAGLRETFWLNGKTVPQAEQNVTLVWPEQIEDAKRRLERFAPYLEEVFPELKETGGIIESELREISEMKDFLNTDYSSGIEGRLMLKMDYQM